jgi:hypothetical protein
MILNSKNHIDQVCMYIGQSYSQSTNKILHYLNKLSSQNQLILCRRQLANRDVRILLPSFFSSSTPENNSTSINYSSNFSSSSSDSSSPSKAENSLRVYTKLDEEEVDDDDDDQFDAIKRQNSCTKTPNLQILYRNLIDDKNFNTFLFNFNRVAHACYLKMFQSSHALWNRFSLDKKFEKNTNFMLLKNEPKLGENAASNSFRDEEFLKNYINILVNLHNQVVSKLYLSFNNETFINCKNKYSNKQNNCYTDRHIFRSFRILSFRKPRFDYLRKHSKINNSCFSDDLKIDELNNMQNEKEIYYNLDNAYSNKHYMNKNYLHNSNSQNSIYTDLIDLRVSFDIRQFYQKTGYDCFIESEFSYYKIKCS